jgi:hypothetical protein
MRGSHVWLPVLALLALVLNAGQGRGDAGNDTTDSTQVDWNDCAACHDMQHGNLPRLSDLRIPGLGAKTRRDCLDCHNRTDLSGIFDIWLHDTQSLADHVDCLACHKAEPHGADNPPPAARWGQREEEGCFECHRSVELALSQQYSHGFAPGVRCHDCHDPHDPLASAVPESILTNDLAELRGSSYDWRESNRACLSCHGEAQLTLGLTDGFVTLNTVNYHDLHLQLGRAMCIECHDPHGSLRPGMIRLELLSGELFGYSWDLEGGTCAVRCHGVEHDGWTYRNKVY